MNLKVFDSFIKFPDMFITKVKGCDHIWKRWNKGKLLCEVCLKDFTPSKGIN